MKHKAVLIWLENQHVKIKSLSSYVKKLDEAAEHSENVIKNKAHLMRKAIKISSVL